MSEASKLFEKFEQNIYKNGLILSGTSPIEELPNGLIKEAIQYGYESEKSIRQVIAVILHAVMVSKKTEFLFSWGILKKMIKKSPYVPDELVDDSMVLPTLSQIYGSGIIKMVSPPSKVGDGKRIAGTYKVILPELLEEMTMEDVRSRVFDYEAYVAGKKPGPNF